MKDACLEIFKTFIFVGTAGYCPVIVIQKHNTYKKKYIYTNVISSH